MAAVSLGCQDRDTSLAASTASRVRPKLIDCWRPPLTLAAVTRVSLRKRARTAASQPGRAGHLGRAEGWWVGRGLRDGQRTTRRAPAARPGGQTRLLLLSPTALYVANFVTVGALALGRLVEVGLGVPLRPASGQPWQGVTGEEGSPGRYFRGLGRNAAAHSRAKGHCVLG